MKHQSLWHQTPELNHEVQKMIMGPRSPKKGSSDLETQIGPKGPKTALTLIQIVFRNLELFLNIWNFWNF